MQEETAYDNASGSSAAGAAGAGSPPNPSWSWNGARLVRELGRGHYGTVYLAEEVSGR